MHLCICYDCALAELLEVQLGHTSICYCAFEFLALLGMSTGTVCIKIIRGRLRVGEKEQIPVAPAHKVLSSVLIARGVTCLPTRCSAVS